MLEIKNFVFNDFRENTIVIWDDDSKEAAIIDPGCFVPAEETELENFINSNNLNPKFLINTHCHLDHIFGNSFVKEKYNPKLLVHTDDLFLFDLQYEHARGYGFEMKKSPVPDVLLKGDESLLIGKSTIKVLHTPGHSPGEICLSLPDEKICVTGDVLFREGVGRTDLWKGDYFVLMDSIQDILFSLPDETVIYPGHGPQSTIGYEKENNPFL